MTKKKYISEKALKCSSPRRIEHEGPYILDGLGNDWNITRIHMNHETALHLIHLPTLDTSRSSHVDVLLDQEHR
jgi:hypothetical protein